jgi:hypothetical protein
MDSSWVVSSRRDADPQKLIGIDAGLNFCDPRISLLAAEKNSNEPGFRATLTLLA